MKYVLTIQADDENEFRQIVGKMGFVCSQPAFETKEDASLETEETTKRHRRTKAEMEAARAEENKAKAEEIAEKDDSQPSFDEVRKRLNDVAEKLGRPYAIKILTALGVKKSDQLKPEQYKEALAQANALLNAGEASEEIDI